MLHLIVMRDYKVYSRGIGGGAVSVAKAAPIFFLHKNEGVSLTLCTHSLTGSLGHCLNQAKNPVVKCFQRGVNGQY